MIIFAITFCIWIWYVFVNKDWTHQLQESPSLTLFACYAVKKVFVPFVKSQNGTDVCFLFFLNRLEWCGRSKEASVIEFGERNCWVVFQTECTYPCQRIQCQHTIWHSRTPAGNQTSGPGGWLSEGKLRTRQKKKPKTQEKKSKQKNRCI